MSSPSQTAAPSSIFKSMLDTALAEYQTKTGDDLLAHWLAAELQTCESVDAVLDILRDQAKAFEQSGDQKLMKWIDPLVHVLYTFSGALGDGVSLAFPPAKVIFTGIGVLLAAAKDARASHGAIIDLFERVESFFKRLGVYTQVSLTTEMAEVLVKIVIELLSILSIATKEVKRRRAKIFSRKLLGRTDIEDALKRLDSLIQEEFQMVTALILKVATEAKDDAGKANMVMQQDMEEVKRDVLEVKRDVVEVKSDVEEVKWTQIEQDIHKWFSPPDPSTNYNIACEAHQEGTAAWFFRGEKFKDWSSIGSLLWVHGKPGSGKSILCSAIITYVMSLRDAGQAALAYFYFDFRDKDKKQDFRNFITSLLVQLSAYSSLCCEIVFRIYSTHGKGTRQPSNDALTGCLREMLSIAAEQPIYIIVDALDECPNASGMPTPRKVVLDLLEGLVRLGLPSLHICITSRPEFDIKRVLEPLPHNAVSLHDEDGQKKDISDYVNGVVYADHNMRSWRDEDKMLVVNELSNRADGMFRWVYCQLEVLQHCFPANIRQTLRELPETLDETYARVLKDINKKNQEHAHRMLQCLLVAVRPLRVEELAELLAFEFDATQGGIPKYCAAWQLGDQTQAVLSTCSSLVAIVSNRWSGRQVVQFSHFSVKEFLMSDRLTSPLGDFSRYHIRPGFAHTILTQACLGSLLHLGDQIDEESVEMSPLVKYAAEHWVKHAQFEDVASRVKDGIETLFDSDKPHFVAWIRTYDIDSYWDLEGSTPNPLYYSTLCGFYDLVKHLATKHPQYVNAICGLCEFPLLAALSEDHAEVAELLLDHGADINARGSTGETLLLLVLTRFEELNNIVKIVKFLLKHGADVNSQDNNGKLSLHKLLENYRYLGDIENLTRLLLEHGADADAEDNNGKTPLDILLLESEIEDEDEDEVLDLVWPLLEFGAEVNRRDKHNRTPLHLAVQRGQSHLAQILLEHGADANAEDDNDQTPFHMLSVGRIKSEGDVLDLARGLLKFGAEMDKRDKDNATPLRRAIYWGQSQLAQVLLEHGADANAEDNNGQTPLHILSVGKIKGEGNVLDLAQRLLKFGAEVNRRDKHNLNATPLHLAIYWGQSQLVQILLEHGADADAEDNNGKTPLHILSVGKIEGEGDVLDLAQRLLKFGAEVNRRDKHNRTPLRRAIQWGQYQLAQILLEHGADANAEDNNGKTTLHILSVGKIKGEGDVLDLARRLLKFGAKVNRRDKHNRTPLRLAIQWGQYQLARILLENGADANMEDSYGQTPLHILSVGKIEGEGDVLDLAQPLLEFGAEVNKRDKHNETPLHLAIYWGQSQLARILLEHGADANAEDNNDQTPLHILSVGKIKGEGDVLDLARRLLKFGAEVNRQDKDNQTPLHLAVVRPGDQSKLAQILLENDADPNAKNNDDKTPLCILSERRVDDERDFVNHARLLLEHGVGVNRYDEDNNIPLLLEIDATMENKMGETSGQQLSRGQYSSRERSVGVAQRSLERGVGLNVRDENQITPSHLQSNLDQFRIAILLIGHGANFNAGKNGGDLETPLYQDIEGGNVQNKNHLTLLHLASLYGWVETVRVELDRGATANPEDNLGRTPLHLVAKESSSLGHYGVRVAQLLLEKGADVDARGKDNETPLHLACCYGSAEMVRVLLYWGATANSKGDLGGTLLRLVAGSEHYPWLDDACVARLLQEHGADVNTQDRVNTTPLHVASYHGRADVVQVPLDRGATANSEGNLGRTPLHLVAGSRYYPVQNGIRIANILLENGADVNAQDKGNITPLHTACYLGGVGMVRLLLDSGAAANSEVSPGRTLLHLVAEGVYDPEYNGARITGLLLEHGVHVDAQDKENTTPLHLASYFGNVEISQVLLGRGATANSKRKLGWTPLHLVAVGKHVNGVRITNLLLEHGADVNAQDEDNTTALHLASFCGKVKIAQVLLDRGAILNSEDNLGRNPMHLAVEGLHNFGHDGVGVARLLLERGTDVNARDKHNTTPLHLASYCGRVEIVRVLLDRGANANATNALGQTPLHMVSRGAFSSQDDGAGITQLLLEHGADVNAEDKNHATPSDLASYHGRTELASLLLHYNDKANANADQGSTPGQLGSEDVRHVPLRKIPEHCPPRT